MLTDDETRLRQGANARAFAEAFLDRDTLLEAALTRMREQCY